MNRNFAFKLVTAKQEIPAFFICCFCLVVRLQYISLWNTRTIIFGVIRWSRRERGEDFTPFLFYNFHWICRCVTKRRNLFRKYYLGMVAGLILFQFYFLNSVTLRLCISRSPKGYSTLISGTTKCGCVLLYFFQVSAANPWGTISRNTNHKVARQYMIS